MENMNPIPDEEGGNLYLINGAMTKLADAGAFAKTDTGSRTLRHRKTAEREVNDEAEVLELDKE